MEIKSRIQVIERKNLSDGKFVEKKKRKFQRIEEKTKNEKIVRKNGKIHSKKERKSESENS